MPAQNEPGPYAHCGASSKRAAIDLCVVEMACVSLVAAATIATEKLSVAERELVSVALTVMLNVETVLGAVPVVDAATVRHMPEVPRRSLHRRRRRCRRLAGC